MLEICGIEPLLRLNLILTCQQYGDPCFSLFVFLLMQR